MKKICDEIKCKINISKEEEKQLELNQVDETYSTLYKIYSKRKIYDMNWAYTYAHDKIDEIFKHTIDTHFNNQFMIEEPDSIKKEINDLIHEIAKSIKNSTKTFNHAQTFIDIGEIITSFLIIMGIHELTEICVDSYSKLINATLIVIIFAFFKIILERKIIHKILLKREYNIFKRTLLKSRKAFVHLFIFKIQVDRFNELNKNAKESEKLSNAIKFVKQNHHIIAN